MLVASQFPQLLTGFQNKSLAETLALCLFLFRRDPTTLSLDLGIDGNTRPIDFSVQCHVLFHSDHKDR